MISSPARFSRMRHVGTAVTLIGVAGGVVLIVLGVFRFGDHTGLWLIVAGGSLACASAVAQVLMRLALKVESNTSRLYTQARELQDAIGRFGRALDKITENTSISEAAKSIAHRDQERDALRGAIYEEVRREDFDAAFHLIDDLESRLGLREEAERLKLEIRDECTEAFRARLKQAIGHIKGLFEKRQWVRARSEIERIEKVMPNERHIADLWRELDQKRAGYKISLISRWKEASSRNDIEGSLSLLKELDPYLTREEALTLESSAREVFKERLVQLGVQFQFAVKEKRWQDALATGLQIQEEFPNSRMAKEVQENLAPLRARAGIPTDYEVTARSEGIAHPADSASEG